MPVSTISNPDLIRHALKRSWILLLIFTLSNKGLAQLNEHLAPLIQNVKERDIKSLNGKWRIIIDPFETGYYNYRYQPRDDGYFINRKPKNKSELVEYNFDESQQLNVPGDWNTQDDRLFYYEGTIWYKKSFDYQKKADHRLFIHFGAINYESIVYLNGERIGKHTGGFTPFNIEITDKIKNGENFVIVKVDNQRKREAIPTVNTDWWNYGGITRDVSIVEVPETFVRDYSIHLNNSDKSEIDGWVMLDGKNAGQEVTISIPELKVNKSVTSDNGKATFSIKAKPERWSPDNPRLYSVSIKSGADEVHDKIGFRTIATEGENILLNGKSVFLKGICIHEVAPFRSGRAFSDEDARILLGWAKELGCNFVRLAHYPHNEYMLKEADRMGLMVWSEIPVYWTILWDNDSTLENAKHQQTESITRDKNRASIIMWSVANETPLGDSRLKFLHSLIEHARTLDNTRLITAASDTQTSEGGEGEEVKTIEDPLAEYLDVIGVNNYCGWYDGLPGKCDGVKWHSDYNKPVIMSEFGGGALQGFHADELTRWSEEYQVNVYENNFKMLKNFSALRGMTPWILMDFLSSRRPLPDIQDNYNRKGLISESGMKKKTFFTLKEFYKEYNKFKKK